MIIAQTTKSETADAVLLALKRWVGEATLTSPEVVAASDVLLRFWLGALLIVMLLALLFQGPLTFAKELIDLGQHRRLLVDGVAKLRGRALVCLFLSGAMLCSWTTSQLRQYSSPANLDNLQLTLRTKTLGMFSLEQGVLAALTPLRDLTNLADCWPMVIAGILAGFQFSSKLEWVPRSKMTPDQKRAQFWVQVFWIVASVWLLYRIVLGVASEGGLPLHTGGWVEIVLEPLVMLLVDSVLIAWILVEISRNEPGDNEAFLPDVTSMFRIFPAISVVCLLVTPGRYLAHALWLGWSSVVDTVDVATQSFQAVVQRVIWALSWGIIDLQMLAFPMILLIGAVAVGDGTRRKTLSVARAMLRNHGAAFFVLLLVCGILDFVMTAVITTILISHPAEPWVLMAADFYCHIATLFIGLLLTACLIELGQRSALIVNEPDA